MVKNWLITGGCGFIGTSLVKELQKRYPQHNIRIFDNLSTGTHEDLEKNGISYKWEKEPSSAPNGTTLFVGDIKKTEDVKSALTGIDVIVHFAANTGVMPSIESPRQDMENNVVGTFNLLEGARVQGQISSFIFASSGAPIGEATPPIHEELACHPVNPYGASKLCGEAYCSAYNKSFDLKTTALRFGNVYGPGSFHKESVVAKFIKQALNDETIYIYGDGNQTRDFIFIEDLIEAIFLAEKSEKGGEVYQIATNRESTVNELVEILSSHLKERNIHPRIEFSEARKGEVLRNFSDTTKAKEQLGWTPSNELNDGIKKTLEYFLGQS